MNVVIAGGGVAGLTAAAVLRRLPFVKSIVIFESSRPPCMDSSEVDGGSKMMPDCYRPSVSHHYNGLWSPAIKCLQSLGIYSHISQKLHPVLRSGYKDVSGRWLAQPTVGLQVPPASPSLAFIENNQLLNALRRSVLSIDASCCTVHIRWGVRVTGVTQSKSSQYVTVEDSTWESHRADLLVAADGTFSTVFSSLHPNSSNIPLSRGYSVYRGYAEKQPPATSPSHPHPHPGALGHALGADTDTVAEGDGRREESDNVRHCSYGFQTWGPSARFACVPTLSGNAWYIAVPVARANTDALHSTLPSNLALYKTADNKDLVDSASMTNTDSRSVSGPFSNGSVRVGQGEFDELIKRFEGWHDPVSNILRDTVAEKDAQRVKRGTGVRVCSAMAFNAQSTISAAYSMGRYAPVVFVGDAAHTLDPILAQGAGLAIEDASLLGAALQNNYRHTSYDSFTVNSYGEKRDRGNDGEGEDDVEHLFQRDAHTVNIKNFLLDFEDSRRYRLRKLEFFSEVSQLLGQVESPALCSIRDTCIYYVPQLLKGAVFDLFIQAVTAFESAPKKGAHSNRRSKKTY